MRSVPITEGLQLFLDDMKKLQEQYGMTEDFVISTGEKKLHTRNLSDYMIKASKKLGFGITDGFEMVLPEAEDFQDMDLAKNVDEALHKAETAVTSETEPAA